MRVEPGLPRTLPGMWAGMAPIGKSQDVVVTSPDGNHFFFVSLPHPSNCPRIRNQRSSVRSSCRAAAQEFSFATGRDGWQALPVLCPNVCHLPHSGIFQFCDVGIDSLPVFIFEGVLLTDQKLPRLIENKISDRGSSTWETKVIWEANSTSSNCRKSAP
jgi:hypothetical protein